MTSEKISTATTRRNLFKLGALSAGALAMPLGAAAYGKGFTHGVASGEPGPNGALLWTRFVAGQAETLRYEVALDGGFGTIAASGDVEASAERDWCAKAIATGLSPDRWYYYRFIAPDGSISDVGRTRTLPEGPTDRFRMAVISCSNKGFGYFNAYRHIAEADEFDLVVHTGDYFYEYGPGVYPSEKAKVEGQLILPDHEIVQLADYRLRYASYRSDPDLRRLHQLYPMVLGWDDHESANDSYRDGAQNHTPETEGEWELRKAAAIRAYREWMPVSDEPWAAYEIGDLATMFRLETRLMGRDRPPDLGAVLRGKANAGEALAALVAFRDGDWRDPSRQMLGETQEAWLAAGLKRSVGAGKKWQVLAQQVIMGNLNASASLLDGMTADTPTFIRQRLMAAAAAAAAGLPLNMDAWDGYPAARESLLQASLEADANLVVLSGDSHNGWAFELAHGDTPVGVEFAGHSVTSPGAESNLPWIRPGDLAAQSVSGNAQLAWANTSQRGYMAVELTPTAASSEYRFMDTVRQRSAQLAGSHRMVAQHGERKFSA